MTRFLSLALAALTLGASNSDAAMAKATKVTKVARPAFVRPSLSSVCAGRTLPFPAPTGDDVEAWTDTDYASWADDAWDDYCELVTLGSYEDKACTCRNRFEY